MHIKKLETSYWPTDHSQPLVEGTVGELLRQVAAEVPERVALVDGVSNPEQRQRWTYRQLLAVAEQAARALLGRFAPGERVAIFAPNSAHWVLLQHAISLAGLVLVPVNPAYSKKELATILDNAGAAGLFYVDEYRGRNIAEMVGQLQRERPALRELIGISDWEAFIATGDRQQELPTMASDDLLQIQYTSGTTGVPKGACLHHRGVINTSRFVALRAGFPEGGVWINAMPLFHIAGTIVTGLGTLSMRGTYVIAPGFDPELMLELIDSEQGNATLIVPTMILALLDSPEFIKRDLSSMQTVLTGAAEVPAALVRRTKKAFGCELSILFGQTEVNGVACQTSIHDSEVDQSDTLGQPLPQAEVCIADPETGGILPIGQAGEIMVRGYQNMTGYYGMEAASRATIQPDGWLHTGDMGVMDERGYLKIAGRIKDMLIRGGMNIYPKEIEDVLFDHPDVGQISVIGVPDDKWGEIVAAVIIPVAGSARPSPEVLFDYCRARLSPHKAPEQWFFVEAFPLTPSGKVQKFVLRDWVADGTMAPQAWRRPKPARRASLIETRHGSR